MRECYLYLASKHPVERASALARQQDARRAGARGEKRNLRGPRAPPPDGPPAGSGRFTIILLKSLHTAGADSLLSGCARLWTRGSATAGKTRRVRAPGPQLMAAGGTCRCARIAARARAAGGGEWADGPLHCGRCRRRRCCLPAIAAAAHIAASHIKLDSSPLSPQQPTSTAGGANFNTVLKSRRIGGEPAAEPSARSPPSPA